MLSMAILRQTELHMPIKSLLVSREWCLVVRPSRSHKILSSELPFYTNRISTP